MSTIQQEGKERWVNVEFGLESGVFADAIAWTAKGLPARPVVPVTAGVVLEVGEGVMTVSGFDFEVLNRIEVPVTEKSAGRVLVSGRLLAEIARALPPQDVRVAVEDNRLALRCGCARFTLPLLPIEDYPATPELPAASGTVRGDVFGTAIAQVTVAASRDETLPVLTGVRRETGPEALTLAATDFDASTETVEAAPARLEAAGRATRHPDGWALPRNEVAG